MRPKVDPKVTHVAVAILKNNNGEFLLASRPAGKPWAGWWEFPGGKIESNETKRDALKRELQEELEMEVKIEYFFGKSNHDYGSFQIELFGYVCSLVNYSGKLIDHDAYKWVDFESLSNYKLAPADIPFIQMIKQMSFKSMY